MDALRWKVGRELAPTGYSLGAGGVWGPWVEEYLTSADPTDIEVTFTALRDRMHTCLGDASGSTDDLAAYEDTVEELALPNMAMIDTGSSACPRIS